MTASAIDQTLAELSGRLADGFRGAAVRDRRLGYEPLPASIQVESRFA